MGKKTEKKKTETTTTRKSERLAANAVRTWVLRVLPYINQELI
jgi:hypothetical protein